LSPGGVALLSGLLFLVIVLALWRFSATQNDHEVRPLSQHRTVTVATTADLASTIEELAEQFTGADPGTRIKVRAIGTEAALTELRRGRVQVAVIARELRADESDLKATSVARDGITLVVHQSNSIAILGDRDIADLYTGRLKNWKYVGGDDLLVSMKRTSAGRVETETLLRFVAVDNALSRAEPAQGSSEDVVRQVAESPEAVGITSIAAGLRQIQKGAPVKLLALREVAADLEAVREGRFPLTTPVNVVTAAYRPDLVQQFVDFTLAPESQALFRARQYVPTVSAGG
jgi:phosphate transport system substrate-binding protein